MYYVVGWCFIWLFFFMIGIVLVVCGMVLMLCCFVVILCWCLLLVLLCWDCDGWFGCFLVIMVDRWDLRGLLFCVWVWWGFLLFWLICFVFRCLVWCCSCFSICWWCVGVCLCWVVDSFCVWCFWGLCDGCFVVDVLDGFIVGVVSVELFCIWGWWFLWYLILVVVWYWGDCWLVLFWLFCVCFWWCLCWGCWSVGKWWILVLVLDMLRWFWLFWFGYVWRFVLVFFVWLWLCDWLMLLCVVCDVGIVCWLGLGVCFLDDVVVVWCWLFFWGFLMWLLLMIVILNRDWLILKFVLCW